MKKRNTARCIWCGVAVGKRNGRYIREAKIINVVNDKYSECCCIDCWQELKEKIERDKLKFEQEMKNRLK